MSELPELLVADAQAWDSWLAEHGATSAGVALVLAKKGTTDPTSLTYDQALAGALCHGWIDGRINSRDAITYRVRFTPRRPRSAWSARNTVLVEALEAAGRMRPAGAAQVELARADGRWAAAYAGSATIEVPDDLAAALDAASGARAAFEALTRSDRYAVLYRVHTARRPQTRASRIAQFVTALSRGEPPVRRGGG